MIDFADLDPPARPEKQVKRPTRRCVNERCQQLIQEGVEYAGKVIEIGDPCPFCHTVLESTHALSRGNFPERKTRPGRSWGDLSVIHGAAGYNVYGCRCPICKEAKLRDNAQRPSRATVRFEEFFDKRTKAARALRGRGGCRLIDGR